MNLNGKEQKYRGVHKMDKETLEKVTECDTDARTQHLKKGGEIHHRLQAGDRNVVDRL